MTDKLETESLGPKERLQILLAEFSSLRAAQTALHTSANQLIGFGIVGLAASASLKAWYLIPVLLVVLGAVAWGLIVDVQTANDRVRELEAQINAMAGRQLLVWQTQGGGIFGRGWRLLVSTARQLLQKINSN